MDPNGQIVSIGFGCELHGIVLHELMHTLGFFHTSSRPDRDAYVIVYTQNIKAGWSPLHFFISWAGSFYQESGLTNQKVVIVDTNNCAIL